MGRNAAVVFLNGTCGDVTQVDNRSLREPEFGEKWSRFVGARVAAEAIKVMVSAERGELTPIAAATKTLTIRRRRPSQARMEKAREIVDRGLRSGDTSSTEWTFAKELVVLEYLLEKEPDVAVEVQGIQIGPVVFLANPAEYFCQLGRDIKQASPFPFTYVVELANGCVGYTPTEEAFSASGGGYETVLTSYSNLEITAGTQIAQASIELSKALKPGAIPEGAKVTPAPGLASGIWDYGVLGPDV
jgi:neutral ceramidase